MAVCLDLPLLPSPSPPGVGERLDYHQWDLLKERKFYQDAGRGGRERRERGGAAKLCDSHLLVNVDPQYTVGLPASPSHEFISGRFRMLVVMMVMEDIIQYRKVCLCLLSPAESVLRVLFSLFSRSSPGPANSCSFLAARPF